MKEAGKAQVAINKLFEKGIWPHGIRITNLGMGSKFADVNDTK